MIVRVRVTRPPLAETLEVFIVEASSDAIQSMQYSTVAAGRWLASHGFRWIPGSRGLWRN